MIRVRVWTQYWARSGHVRWFSATCTRLNLRQYQQESIEAVQDALNRGKRAAISLPTGSGKTRIFSHLLKNVQPRFKEDVDRSKVLVIVNRKELAEQAASTISLIHPDLHVSEEMDDAAADVLVTTYHKLISLKCYRLHLLNPSEFKLIIIDEAHHSAADSYLKVLAYFDAVGDLEEDRSWLESETGPRVFDSDEPVMGRRTAFQRDLVPVMRRYDHPERRVHVVGFSATFWRNDKEFLSNVFDEVSHHESVERLIREGYLCPGKVQRVQPLQSDKNETSTRDFFLGDLTRGSEFVYDLWAHNSDRYKHTVVFGINKAHIQNMCDVFRANGIDARQVTGSMPLKQREATIEAFKQGLFPVLLNCQILTEGTDIPSIDQIIIARGVRSAGLAMQIIGRGLRLHPEKDHCNIVMFPNTQNNASTTFLPMLENTLERYAGTGNPRTTQPKAPSNSNYRDMVFENEDLSLDLLSSNKYKPETPSDSVLQWTKWQKNYYLFPWSKSYSVISRRENSSRIKVWQFARVSRINARFTKRQEIFSSKDLSEVTQYADHYHKLTLTQRTLRALLYKAKWLAEPMTSKQIEVLRQIKGDLLLGCVRRGTAARLINLHGIGCKLSQEMVDRVVEELTPGTPSVADDKLFVRKPNKWFFQAPTDKQISFLTRKYPRLDFRGTTRGVASELIQAIIDGEVLDQSVVDRLSPNRRPAPTMELV